MYSKTLKKRAEERKKQISKAYESIVAPEFKQKEYSKLKLTSNRLDVPGRGLIDTANLSDSESQRQRVS